MPLVARAGELERVEAVLDAGSRAPAGVVIEGEAGLGKTALFDAVLSGVDRPVLVARCAEVESTLVYTALADLLDGQTAELLPNLPPPWRRALEVALLHSDFGPDVVEPHTVGRATLDVLRRLAAAGPIVLAIDDVQWIDAASARALSFAIRRFETERVTVLLARRGDGPLPLGLDAMAAAVRLALPPLSRAETEAVLRHRFGAALTQRSVDRVLAVAAGNPLYAIELTAAGSLTDSPATGPVRLPPRLEDLVVARVRNLPPATAEPLAAVACLAAPTLTTLSAVVGSDARARLDPAVLAGVIHLQEDRPRFSHPLLGMAALTALPPSARHALHVRIAEVVTDPEERARHRCIVGGEPDAAVAAEIERGADVARARGAPEAAAELAETATRLTPPTDVGDLIRRRLATAYHWATAGDPGRARGHLAAALTLVPAGPLRTDLRWRLGMLCHLDGDTAEAVGLLEACAAELAGSDDLAARANIGRKLAGLYGWQGRLREANRLAEQAVAWAESASDQRILVESLMTFAMNLQQLGEPVPETLLGRVADLARHTGRFATHEDPATFLATALVARGDHRGGEAALVDVLATAEDQGDEYGVVIVLSQLVICDLSAGEWQRGAARAEEALARARTTRAAMILGSALMSAATIRAHLGDETGTRALVAELIAKARSHHVLALELLGRSVLGFLELSRGDPRAAHDQFGPLLAQYADIGLGALGYLYLPWFDVDARVELGDIDGAEELATDMRRRGDRLGHPFSLALAARGRGLVRAARGDLAGAEAELDWAIREQVRLGVPFEQGRALLTLGSVLRRDKRKRAAREALEQAKAIFERLGARLWIDRATDELSRVGGRRPGGPGLTATETQVVRLVSEGATNRGIADRLFLSEKTVASHLTRVYAKLGVRSRTELLRHLRDHPLDP